MYICTQSIEIQINTLQMTRIKEEESIKIKPPELMLWKKLSGCLSLHE